MGFHCKYIRRSVKPWPGTLFRVVGQVTVLSQCLCQPRSINGLPRIQCRGQPCDGPASNPGGVEILLAVSCRIKTGDKRRPEGPLTSYEHFTFILIDKRKSIFNMVLTVCLL